MFFLLSKILQFVISPLVWVLLLLIIVIRVKKEKTKRLILTVTLVALYLLSNPALYNIAITSWETPASEINEPHEVAIVLLGFTSLTQTPKKRVHVTESVNRITQLIPLYRSGLVKKILLAGGSPLVTDTEKNEASETKKLLLEWGIPETDILIEPNSRNTYENLVNAKVIMKEKCLQGKILLVTSGYHLRRAKACADKLNMSVTCYATDFRSLPSIGFSDYFLPSTHALDGFEKLFHEWIGFLVYKTRGYC